MLWSPEAPSGGCARIALQQKQNELEQLERLRSEDTRRRLMIIDYPYHWVILDPKSKEDKVKVKNLKKIRQNFKFLNFEMGITRDTPSEVAW